MPRRHKEPAQEGCLRYPSMPLPTRSPSRRKDKISYRYRSRRARISSQLAPASAPSGVPFRGSSKACSFRLMPWRMAPASLKLIFCRYAEAFCKCPPLVLAEGWSKLSPQPFCLSNIECRLHFILLFGRHDAHHYRIKRRSPVISMINTFSRHSVNGLLLSGRHSANIISSSY